MIGFLITLGLAITLHELGHFLVAKAVGIRVVRFSIGFGPKLLGIKWGDTEYVLAPIPLGGYVKMAGDNPEEELKGEAWEFLSVSPWKRILVVVAGPLMNVFLAFGIYYCIALFPGVPRINVVRLARVREGSVAEQVGLQPRDIVRAINGQAFDSRNDMETRLATLVNGRQFSVTLEIEREGRIVSIPADLSRFAPGAWVNEVVPDMPAARAGLEPGSLITEVNGVPIGTFQDLADRIGQNLVREGDTARVHPIQLKWRNASGEVLIRDVTPEVILEGNEYSARIGVSNYPAREVRFVDLVYDLESPFLGAILYVSTEVGRVMKKSPAWEGGLRQGDRIIAVNGEPVDNWYDLADQLYESRTYPSEVGNATSETDGQPAMLYRSEPVPITLTWMNTEGETVSRILIPRIESEFNPFTGEPLYHAVVGLGPRMDRHRMGLIGSIGYAAGQVGEKCMLLLRIIPRIITREMSSKVLGGPVKIFQASSQQAAWGLEQLFILIAMLSANLAVINLLPIPVLDGGHILLYTVEGIRRKRLTLRQIEIFTKIGLAILLPLIAFIILNDLIQIRLFEQIGRFLGRLWVF